MTLKELIPAVRSLTRTEKRQLVELLSQDLSSPEAQDAFPQLPFLSPWNEDEAAKVLQQMLDEAGPQP